MPSHQSPFQRNLEDREVPAPPDPISEARQQEVVRYLKQIIEPTLKSDIVSLGMVRNLRVVDNYIYLRLYIGKHQHGLQAEIQKILSPLTWCKKIYIQL